MPNLTQTSDFWGWYLRHNNRVVWKDLQDAGIDVFTAGPSNNPQAFLDLTNVVPAVSGGFTRRWGVEAYAGNTLSTDPDIVRTFIYSTPQDNSDPTNTANTNIWLGTDNQNFYTYTDSGSPFTGFGPSNFAHVGDVHAVNSRSWLYYGNGVDAPRKVNPSYTTADTDSLVGIALPVFGSVTDYTSYPYVIAPNTSSLLPGVITYSECTGYGYLTAPTITVVDPTGAGSGCTVGCSIGIHGEVDGFGIITPGSGYVQANAVISAPPAGGVQASLVLYVQANSAAPRFGQVINADFGGQMQFIAGRQYAVALQNSLTGHTSDVYTTNLPIFPKTGLIIDELTASYTAAEVAVGTTIPVYIGSSSATAGYTQLEIVISVPTAGLDPQVDTVVLLATSDGGSVGTLYEVKVFPLSAFTPVTGAYQMYYVDNLPDSFNDQNLTGDTLLEADLWAYTDSAGDQFGILLNTPPTPAGFLYPTQHQGRMFATDGKTVFFSKSLDEVTTPTGLVTSKWEECWPGDYQLPIALNNEQIIGLKSDGVNLHVGTTQSMFTIYGSDPDSFSVPSVAFSETGILSDDCWAVVYAEGQPSGFVWITQDFKVIHSDFSTYREIGTPILPILQQLDIGRLANAKVESLTQGPYNFVFLQFHRTVMSGFAPAPEFWIWETRLQKWYRWRVPASDIVAGTVPSSFIYQFPSYTTASSAPGSKYLFYWLTVPTSGIFDINFQRFNPTFIQDGSSPVDIPWNIRTSWQDFGDPTAIKVLNEIEVVGDDAPYIVTLWKANSQSQFDSGGIQILSNPTITGPISSLDSNKMYCAGAATAAKYYSIQIQPQTTGTQSSVITSFSTEAYPMTRI